FFLGSVTVAGALTGLLFVALSVAQSRGRGLESAERQAVAATAFTALVDSLWVSLVALLPGSAQQNGGISTASFLLGVLGVTSTASLTVRLWRAREDEDLSRRWPLLLPLIVIMYAFQAITAYTSSDPDRTGSTFVLIFFAIGIIRSWELLGLRGGGPLDFLARRAVPAVPAGTAGTPRGPGEPGATGEPAE
ncbi:MAG TPA: hypothetical protein VF843_15515, partial [Streptosporangiaceae bacterium]